ncbi:hypothetical protein NL676_027300 [Syzygium grande]|nr:hypothetical protein NL676_027300 [Syzygium grande]
MVDAELKVKMLVKTGAALQIHIDAGRIRSDHGLERSYRDSTGPETIIAMEEARCLSQMWDSPVTLTMNST